tara:strand:+ start:1943 stop:2713 length:771 start_codon:yes stop_codon:yes gene_type:complete
MKNRIWLSAIILFGVQFAEAQGPPITADKPIMLGGGSFTAKTLTEIRHTERGDFTYVPVMLHYLPTSNSLVAIHLPYINYDIENGPSGSSLADIKIMGKYQFFRKDGTGKTFRMVAKTLQTLPTGKDLDVMELSTGKYAGYYGIVAGYESLKYGISNELGYNWMPDGTMDALMYKIGFGLPLLKPQYPNKQVNLYFEYTNAWLVERDWYQLLYAQGIQYARKNVTFDFAVQVPIVNDIEAGRKLKYSLFLGSRYSF